LIAAASRWVDIFLAERPLRRFCSLRESAAKRAPFQGGASRRDDRCMETEASGMTPGFPDEMEKGCIPRRPVLIRVGATRAGGGMEMESVLG
jgi:hypothetical protein